MVVACSLTLCFMCWWTHTSAFSLEDEYLGFGISPWESNLQFLQPSEPPAINLGYDAVTGCYSRKIPNVRFFGFGRDSCDTVPQHWMISEPTFTFLNTNVRILMPSQFAITENVTKMLIEGHVNLTTIMADTFKYNTKLVNLSISFNFKLNVLHPHSFRGLVNLRSLYLAKNGFNRIYDVTRSLSPNFVPKLEKLCMSKNNFLTVSENDFSPMQDSMLKVVHLVLCRIDYIHPNSLKPLKNLRVLKLNDNNFNISTITKAMERNIQLQLPLQLLDLSSIGLRMTVPRVLLEVIAKSNITALSLSRNHFEVISADSFPYMPNLEVLDLRSISALEIEDEAFHNLPKLKKLGLSGNKLYTMQKGMLLPNLAYLNLEDNSGDKILPSYFNVHNMTFSNMSRLLYLNLNSNSILHLYSRSFQGLDNLEILSMKNASIYHIPEFTFQNLQHLKCLNLENNLFVKYEYERGIRCNLFAGLENLQVLFLGGCDIKFFSPNCNPFIHLKSLLHLDLQRNWISHISPTQFEPLVSLTSIDLSLNLLTAWDVPVFPYNNNLQKIILSYNKLNSFSISMLDDFSKVSDLELYFNPFDCNCKMVALRSKWIKTKQINTNRFNNLFVKANCLTDNLTVAEFFVSVQKGEVDCDFSIIILIPFGLLLICCTGLCLFIYYYRWHFKYWIFLTRLYLSRSGKMRLKRKNQNGEYNHVFDAFVSYCNEDSDFVIKLISMLENSEPYLRLCVYERDFQIGSVISESVLENLTKSRKTLLVISDNYAKSQWCRWESQIAEHHRLFSENNNGENVDDGLILVKLGTVDKCNLSPTLRYLLKTRIYIEWGSEHKKQKLFWERLRHTLAPPNCQFETTHM